MPTTHQHILSRLSVLPFIGTLLALAPHNENVTRATSTGSRFTIIGSVRADGTLDPVGSAVIQVANAAVPMQVLTGNDGHYTLLLPNSMKGSIVPLEVRAIGYKLTQLKVRLDADTVRADAVMIRDVNRLSELVVQNVKTSAGQRAADRIAASPPVSYASPSVAPTSRTAQPMGTLRKDQPRQVADAARKNREDLSIAAPGDPNREQYDRIEDNPFLAVSANPRSTFSVDVDRASYGNVRRFLTAGNAPPADAVRIEEMVNYFPYTLAEPKGNDPIAITTEVAPAPWQNKHKLVRVALQARRIEANALPPSNLVFLIDVSGSMDEPDKLPLVKESLRLLVGQLREQDRVALVVYAGNAGLVLPSTSGVHKARIAEAIDRLEAGGSTAGGAGLELAYRVARENFLPNGNNRVILATDGDFNVGASSDAAMERLIESKRSEGTYLTALGFGTGNYQDAKMKKIAKIGNGNYAYVDNIDEARKTLVHELGSTLVTVANDVKLQIEFNPAAVSAYRLIGYEDRLLRDEDFTDDKKDAGDMGAGHSVTALYEVVPVGVNGTVDIRMTDALRYTDNKATDVVKGPVGELMYVKLRYKKPGESTSKLMTQVVLARSSAAEASDDFRFAAAVASFGMLLRSSEYRGSATAASVLQAARGALGEDNGGYRSEFVTLVQRWQDVSSKHGIVRRD